MLQVLQTIFWVSLFILLYTYVGYPLLLLILAGNKTLFRKATTDKSDDLSPVTLVITAFNEEDIIEEKIRNLQQLDYPEDLLQILFVTDGSTDNTPQIVKQYPRFKLLHQPERKGKLAAMDRAVEFAGTAIIIFNDANGYLNAESIRRIVRHYSDPKVGAVSGEKKVLQSGNAAGQGEGLYWKYESLLKHLDSQLNTVVGAAGELFSIRRNLYVKLPPDTIIEDFVQSLLLCRRGYVVRYEQEAWSAEAPSLHLPDEIERKIRISAGGFQAISRLSGLLNVFRHPLLTFQYVSHRVLRWTLAPVSLILLYISNWLLYLYTLADGYLVFALVQTLFYLAAFLGWVEARNKRKSRLLYVPFYFVLMNWCVFPGFFRFISGRQEAVWKKAARK